MKSKTLLFSVMLMAVSLASFADVILPGDRGARSEDPRTIYEWEKAPMEVRSSRGCASPNICVGDYVKKLPGYTGTVVVGRGLAVCNSLGSGICPDARSCVNDNDLRVNQRPAIRSVETPLDGRNDRKNPYGDK